MAQRLRNAHRFRRDSEVQQYRHGQNRPDAQTAGNVGHVQRRRLRPSAAYSFSGRGRWRRIEQATMSYGYGVSVSLFQIARAYTVLARDGQLLPVTIFKNDDEPVY